jgi:IS1 family transposase
MNKLSTAKRTQVVTALVEGCSINSTVRMTGAAKNTILKLLAELGEACAQYQDKTFQGLNCRTLQCDEIWSYCYSKEKNIPEEKRGVFGYGDVWTWTAICADCKLVPCWHHGRRDAVAASQFIDDLAGRLAHRVQLTTDGHRPYLQAVEDAFGGHIDYAMLIKLYGNPPDERRYSPGECIGCEIKSIVGNPDPERISTSYVERQNLTMRMSMRRFTRLTNAFSKKLDNLRHSVSLHYMYYNFARIHKTLRCSPAQECGITDRLWDVRDIVRLLD